MRHLSSTFSCSRAQDSFKFSLIFSHWGLITQIISSVNAIFHQRRNTYSSTTSIVSPPFDETYFSLTFLMCGFYLNPSSAPYFLRLRMCLGQPLTRPWHHTVLLASSNPLRFLPSHFLSLSQALWVIFQLLIFSLPLPLYPFLSRCQFKPACWEEKWKSEESEIWCPSNLSNPVPWYSRGWHNHTAEQRGGDGHPSLSPSFWQMSVNTHRGVIRSRGSSRLLFPFVWFGKELILLGKGMIEMARTKLNFMFWEDRKNSSLSDRITILDITSFRF